MFAGLTGGLMLASVLPVSVLGAASYSQELQEAYNYAYSKGITTFHFYISTIYHYFKSLLI